MRDVPFVKMHGLGNDFVVVDARDGPIELSRAQIERIADRHRGVGFDQLVRLETSRAADLRLVFFNADGSEAGACGNGTRCAARLVLDETERDRLSIETRGGLLEATRRPDGLVTVAMAAPRQAWKDIPLAQSCDTLEVPLEVPGLGRPTAVSMGNPHAVFFVDDPDALDVVALGRPLERHPMFPERANIGFARILDPRTIRLRVFERGVGLTQACGSGACAAHVAAYRRGLVEGSTTVQLDGGRLDIAWDGDGPVRMTGPTTISFTGRIRPEMFDG
jgi:diaminopimelate epimerase